MSSGEQGGEVFVFPAWHNKLPAFFFGVIGPLFTVLVIGGVWYYFSPEFTDVGYQPVQPIDYSHKLHAGDLQLDCRYCHTGVEVSAVAGVPPTQTCMNCHSQIKKDSPKLTALRESWSTNNPVEWKRIHKLPDYVYFDHSAHIKVGVGCESCHGRVDQMERVAQEKPLSMGWCLACHRDPKPNLRPLSEVTTMGYEPKAGDEAKKADVNPPVHCSGCHQ
ncbi:cytochrome c family protein [Myxococcota bacterium]|nr:cytochrome c family protein [Myxococcota bacterium]MBU1429128.1 cytochrome c family protein [Myxococcota bacterium]MBU1899758.1 cytochrome c family protein [Myxococcota bacterium]